MAARHRRLSEHRDAIGGYRTKAVVMPPVSWGQCRIVRCGVVGDLADRLCRYHWDRGLDRGLDRRDKGDMSAVK